MLFESPAIHKIRFIVCVICSRPAGVIELASSNLETASSSLGRAARACVHGSFTNLSFFYWHKKVLQNVTAAFQLMMVHLHGMAIVTAYRYSLLRTLAVSSAFPFGKCFQSVYRARFAASMLKVFCRIFAAVLFAVLYSE